MNTVQINGFWVAFSDDGRRGVGGTREQAVFYCERDGCPLTHHYTYYPGFAEADPFWHCFHDEYPGVNGQGDTPKLAYEAWLKESKTAWHQRRIDKLFESMKDAAVNLCFCMQDHDMLEVAEQKRDEVMSFITAWMAGEIGVIRNGRTPSPTRETPRPETGN